MKRSPGRPPLPPGQKSTPVSVRVSERDHDAACRKAKRDRVSVPTLFRRGLQRVLREDE